MSENTLRPASAPTAQAPNRFKQVNGFTVIVSKTFARADSTTARVIILAARPMNIYSDDYEYVVAEMDDWQGVGWPSGQYFRTLDLALSVFNERVDYTKKHIQFPVVQRLV